MDYLLRSLMCGLLVVNLIASDAYSAAVVKPSEIVSGFNDFAFDLYRKVDKSEKNQALSPYSLTSLLALLGQGASGDTYIQLLVLLHFNGDEDVSVLLSELNKIDASLHIMSTCNGFFSCKWNRWFGPNEQTKLFTSANAWWADDSFSYQSSFENLMEKNPNIKFYKVNFKKAPEQAREKINRWVEKNTKNRIKELLPPASVSNATRLILTNALYFKGNWVIPFKPEKTQPKPFTLINGEIVSVPTMQHQDKFYYAENDQLQMLHLPYNKTKLAMLILLPKANHSLQDVEQSLNTNVFSQLLLESYKQDVMVSLPKFSFESTFAGLDKSLQALGWTDAFNDKADFYKISKEKLLISDIIQKTMIQVDEEGTVVAAATAAVMETTAYMPTVDFEVNKPFLFMIYDTESKLVLFLGQVVDPRQVK